MSEPATTFDIGREDLDDFRQMFEPPDETELRSTEPDPPPSGYQSWSSWAAERWPTSLD